MLSELIGSIPSGNAKHPLALYRLINAINTRMEAAKARFNATDVIQRTPGVELIRWMLINFDLEAASSYTDMTDLFIDHIGSYRNKYKCAFDPVFTKSIVGGRFIKGPNNKSIPEIILDSSRKSAMSLPLGGYSNWSDWKDIRAIRMLYNDSSELAIDCIPGFITYTKKVPSFAVFSIDISVLLMKWTLFNLQYEGDKDVFKFIHNEYESFYDDMATSWFINFLTTVITHPELSTEQIVAEQYVPAYVTGTTLIEQAVDSLRSITNLIPDRAVRLQDILDTQLHPEWPSIREYVKSIQDDVYVQDDRRYLWMNMIRFVPLMRIMNAVFKQDPDNPQYGQVMRRMYNWYVKNLKFSNLPTMQWSNVVKSFIEDVCREFEDVFSGQIQTDKGEPIQADA
jgi:hypothetical protein